tara:strand:- start:24 stop:149 length:126 start_codon:yes stop_codon:yes gene_type:complete
MLFKGLRAVLVAQGCFSGSGLFFKALKAVFNGSGLLLDLSG